MNLLIFATFILFTSILSIVIRRHNRSDKKHQEQFWEREAGPIMYAANLWTIWPI